MKQPLVTISIPTFNSAKTLRLCLDSVVSQTYKNIEINIIDGSSKDDTLKIANIFDIPVKVYKGALLGARYEGTKIANGEYVLLLDSDQILEKDAIERAVQKMQINDLGMLVFEESVYSNKKFIEKLFELDRKLIHQIKDFSPFTGVMLPRFYQKDLLLNAFMVIPKDVLEQVGGQDHAIIYFEAWGINKKIELLNKAVMHIEPNSLRVIWKKFYRWGYTSVNAHHERYIELLSKKEGFRKGIFRQGLYIESFASILLLIIKGIPYIAGYIMGKIKK